MAPTEPFDAKSDIPELEDEDQKALRLIEELESENNPNNAEPEPEPVVATPLETPTEIVPYPVETIPSIDGVSDVPVEVVPEESIEIEEPVVEPETPASPTPVAAAIASALQEPDPVEEPQLKPKKKSRTKLFLIVGGVIILLTLAVAGYFVWQSLQVEDPIEAAQTTGNQTQSTDTNNTNDTEAIVNDAANSIESETDAIDDSSYADSTLSDTTLYEN